MAQTVKSGDPMWWMGGLLLMGMFGRALAQDNPSGSKQIPGGSLIKLSSKRCLIMRRRCQPTVFLLVYEKDVRIAIGYHTPIVVQRQCLPPMIQVLHLSGRYLENTDHLEKGVNP